MTIKSKLAGLANKLPTLAAAAVVATVGATAAMAGADATFNTALTSFTGFLEGSGGRIITGPKGPKVVTGAIGGAYSGTGGPGGKLGLPISDELSTRDGKGRFNRFEHGRITWDSKNGTKVLM
ncbi:hypothetical protein [uncultured Sphingorhabdus sp.]|uniref:LGFP repeat-containing protein n=1 Tax=uncultured Sphingorhabdus sp. TaxID=1686106 RepID=UPI002605EB58|nr:hypothetical protein [uncultured Sphingorhabdus sp.]